MSLSQFPFRFFLGFGFYWVRLILSKFKFVQSISNVYRSSDNNNELSIDFASDYLHHQIGTMKCMPSIGANALCMLTWKVSLYVLSGVYTKHFVFTFPGEN